MPMLTVDATVIHMLSHRRNLLNKHTMEPHMLRRVVEEEMAWYVTVVAESSSHARSLHRHSCPLPAPAAHSPVTFKG